MRRTRPRSAGGTSEQHSGSSVARSIADGAPNRVNGRLAASTAPGLGVKPKMEVLGKPVFGGVVILSAHPRFIDGTNGNE